MSVACLVDLPLLVTTCTCVCYSAVCCSLGLLVLCSLFDCWRVSWMCWLFAWTDWFVMWAFVNFELVLVILFGCSCYLLVLILWVVF